MICPNCHANTKDGSVWCSNCGYQLPLYTNPVNNSGPEVPQNHTYDKNAYHGDQGSYIEYRKRMEEQKKNGYIIQPDRESAPQPGRNDAEPKKAGKTIFGLKKPVFFAIASAALTLIVAVILLLTLDGSRNLGKIEVHLKHGDLVIGQTYSAQEILEIIDDGGYTDEYNPKDGVRKLYKKYGLADDSYNKTELWFHQQGDEWILYKGFVGRKGYGVEDIIIGEDFEKVLNKYPDFTGNMDLSSENGADQWHLHLDEDGKVVDAYISLQEYHEDSDDFYGIVIRVIVDAHGEIVYITATQY